MSYQIEGKGQYYHSIAELEKAKLELQQRRAVDEAENLRKSVRNLESQIAADREELNHVQGDLRRQSEINRRIESSVAGMKREQQMLERRAREAEAEMKAGFEQVRHTFDEVRGDLQRGLAQAEERRAQSEAMLQGEVDKVRAEAGAREAARLKKAQGRLEQAAEQFKIAGEILDAQLSRLNDLDLADSGVVLRQTIAHGQRLVAGQDASAAQALATTAMADARGLEQNVVRRREALDSARAESIQRAEFLKKRLTQDTRSELADYFSQEMGQVNAQLQRIVSGATMGFQHHQTLLTERGQMNAELNELDELVLEMLSAAPSVKVLADKRIEQAKLLIKKLESEYGPRTSLHQGFESPDDPKSALILNCAFGGSKVRLSMDLDGGYSLDGYGHSSNSDCSRYAESLVRSLTSDIDISRQEVSTENRQEPGKAAMRQQPEYRRIGQRLKVLGKPA